MENPRFSFNGNVNVGNDVDLCDLRKAYHVTIVANGAQISKKLPEDNFPLQLDAHEIMRWINGHPFTPKRVGDILQKSQNIVIVGVGNAALDVARILMMGGTSYLSNYESFMPTHVIDTLNSLRIKSIRLIARRTALSSAFSTREFRHCINLFPIKVENVPQSVPQNLSRADKRKMDVIMSCLKNSSSERKVVLSYLRRPLKHVDNVLTVGVNQVDESVKDQIIEDVGNETYPCDQLITSLGSQPDFCSHHNNIFCCGWARTGSIGTVHDTLVDSTLVTTKVEEMTRELFEEKKWGLNCSNLTEKMKKLSVVSSDGWRRVKEYENEHKTRVGDYDRLMQLCNS